LARFGRKNANQCQPKPPSVSGGLAETSGDRDCEVKGKMANGIVTALVILRQLAGVASDAVAAERLTISWPTLV
jgi:hypothetical protein